MRRYFLGSRKKFFFFINVEEIKGSPVRCEFPDVSHILYFLEIPTSG